MKIIAISFFLTAVISLGMPSSNFAQPQPAGSVWVAPHPLPDGTVIPGYYRAPFRKGFYWVKGKTDQNGNWIPAYWQPLRKAPSGQAWAPGYWDGTIWVGGFWRPSSRPGYIWAGPSWQQGHWKGGHWRAYKGGQPFRVPFPKK